MTVAGQSSGADIIRNVTASVVKYMKRRKRASTSTCDGRILRLHYEYTFYFLFGIFSIVMFSWFYRDNVTCVSKYNAEGAVRPEFVNLCLSYNFFKDPVENRIKNILFYKWIPISTLILALVYYSVRKISKFFDNEKALHLLEVVAAKTGEFQRNPENAIVSHVVNYMAKFQRAHNGLFYRYFICNIIAMIVNVICFFTLDFFLQGRFVQYGLINIFTMYRDPIGFTDEISRTFPPFTHCEITPLMQIVSERTERLGCHLTHMELYEKLFFFLWWWLLILFVLTVLYIAFLFVLMFFKSFRVFLLRVSKTDSARSQNIHIESTIRKLVGKCSIGEIYLLYRLKQFTSPRMFFEIVSKLEPMIAECEIHPVSTSQESLSA